MHIQVSRRWALVVTAAVVAAASGIAAPRAAHAAGLTFTVNSAGDESDVSTNGVCLTSVGTCTLRAALREADAANAPVTIAFAIPGAGVHTITPATVLPGIANPSFPITVDGFTQPGTAVNTAAQADNAVRLIELAGQGTNGLDGLEIPTNGNTIRGLIVHTFHVGITLESGAANNTLEGNLLGLLPNGTKDPIITSAQEADCVLLQSGASSNHIGVPGVANRNVISGCGGKGVSLFNPGTNNNVIQNNIIGLDPTGMLRRANSGHGVDVNDAAQNTLIGGSNAGEGNVISGNGVDGVEISHGAATTGNKVINNFIGTDVTGKSGSTATRNGAHGVRLEGDFSCNPTCHQDEGNELISGNVITFNAQGGVFVDKGVHDSSILNNRIGTTTTGAAAGNGLVGVRIEAGSDHITVRGNDIAYSTDGVLITPFPSIPAKNTPTYTLDDTISQNMIHNITHALPIDLYPFGTVNQNNAGSVYVNQQVNIPVLSANTVNISGTTCAGCRVELFVSPSSAAAYGPSSTFLYTANANAMGHVLFSSGSLHGKVVTATTTTPQGSTSEFAHNISVP